MTGRIRSLGPNYAFIAGEDGKAYFFHDSDRVDDFDFELKPGDVVTFQIVEPEPVRGPRARQVAFVEGAAS